MSQSPHHEPQQAAADSPVSPQSSSGLFPPYYPEITTSLPRSDTSSTGQRVQSQASNITSSHIYAQGATGAAVGNSTPKKKSIWHKVTYFFLVVLNRGWSIEYISCLISVAAYVSIVVVLNRYDQKAMPSWPLGISLNTLLAFLTAISQTCFVQPVVQGLSQMKWNWFAGKDRPLVDFESFDNASRGAWGSILLVFSTKGRLSVLLAAIILVTSAVTSTITQAALSQDTRYTPGSGNATAERLINDQNLQTGTINEAMAVMMNAMYFSANSTYDFDAPLCSTGNCDWPTFGSLAVCSQTNDITDQLRTLTGQTQCCWQNSTANKLEPWNWGPEVCQNCTYSGLPNGFYLNYFASGNKANTSNIWLSSDTDSTAWSKVYSFTNDSFGQNALNAVQVVYLDSSGESYYNASLGLPNSTVLLNHSRAAETLFYLCAQTYDVSTTNGTAVTTINATSHTINDTQKITITDDSGHYTQYTNHAFLLDGQNYSYIMIDWNLGKMLDNFASGFYNDGAIGDGLDVMTPFSYAVGNTLYHTVDVSGSSNATGDALMRQALAGMVDNMAKGLTNWLRSKGTSVEGQSNTLEVFVVVKWDFLIFLGVQVVLSAAFLVWIVADSKIRKTKILKESALATLLAIPGSDREYLESLLSTTEEGELGAEQREDIEQKSRARLIKDAITGQWGLKVVGQKA